MRVRNKQEPVYRSPAFLKRSIGVISVSESGIFCRGQDYSRLYVVERQGEFEELIAELRQMDAEYEIFTVKEEEKRRLILHTVQKDMTDARIWFDEAEQRLLQKGIALEERLGYYGRFLNGFLGTNSRVDSYLLETAEWKSDAWLAGLKAVNRASVSGMPAAAWELETSAGAYAVLAVRSFPMKLKSDTLGKLQTTDGVEEICISVIPVSDWMVADAIREEYLGLDGILPRLKRSSPLIYEILSREEEKKNHAKNSGNTQSFVRAGVYFLLTGANKEELKERMQRFLADAEGEGIWAERIPLAELHTSSELRQTLAMFGMMGTRQERYQSFFPSSDLIKLIPGYQMKEDKEQTYDVEEMRMLFFDREAQNEPE